jgi:hypothetical protein
MNRRFTLLSAALLAAVGVAATILIHTHDQKRRFYAQAFKQLEGGRRERPMITVDFKAGGSALVILEHACCSGAGFDAVAIRTSDGQEFAGEKNYCGLEGFRFDLDAGSTDDLASFSAFLKQRGYRER